MVLPVILSGGIGSRLWPLSREAHPKPFIKLGDGESLLQKTYMRAKNVATTDEIVTVTNRNLFFYTKDDFENTGISIDKNTFLLEPVGRNSAAAIAVAAQYALAQHGYDCVMLIMPADHLIKEENAFSLAVSRAEKLALEGKLVTFGIKPSFPATGYGYILADGNRVQEFVEKPDRETAEKYVVSGNYFWNSGMFCMCVGRFLEELSLFAPDVAEQALISVAGAKQSSVDNWQQYELQRTDFEAIQSISVDYAVFEKSQEVAVVPCDIGWSDIGSWNELGGLYPADENHNNKFGKVICSGTHDCIVHGGDRLVATLGVKDLIISDTKDALLVAHKDSAQNVRAIVDELKSHNDPVYKDFSTVHRTWGTYTVLQEGVDFKLKRIEMKSGARLCFKLSKRGCAHLVIVRGKALVTNGVDLTELKPSQSIFIPVGNEQHLENPGPEKLILMEIQSGEYLNEDDTMRYGVVNEQQI